MREEKYKHSEESEGSKSYFELFKHNRVAPGKVLSKYELCRRLAYELQVPIRLGTRLHNGMMRTIADAVQHHEGINFDDLFTVRTQTFKSEYANHPYLGKIKRPSKYKLKLVQKSIKPIYKNHSEKE